MKRNDLVARSLTLGLAVATAAASMSTPGGLMAPVTVQAAETGTSQLTSTVDLTTGNISKYFQLDPIAILSEGSATADYVNLKGAEATGAVTVLYQKDQGEAADSISDASAKDVYKVLIKVAGGTELNETSSDGVLLGTITLYDALSENPTITYKVGAQDTIAETVQKSAVTISADGYTVGADEGSLAESYNFTSDQTGEISKNLLFKKEEAVLAKKITLKFDVDKPVISKVEATATGDETGTVTVTATDKTVGESSNLTYTLTQSSPESESTIDPDTNSTGTATFNLTGLSPATTYTYTLTVKDAAGNETTYNDTITFTTEKSDCSVTKPTVGTFDPGTRKLTFTVVDGKAEKDYEYSLDGGSNWTKGDAEGTILTIDDTTATLQIDNSAYKANDIQLRVAETDTEKAGTAVPYPSAIDEKDVTAPELSAIEAPQSNDITANSAKISIQSTEAGKAYYVVKETEASSITAEDIKKDEQKVEVDSLVAGTSKEIIISDKASNKTYYVYVVAEDAAGNLSDVQSVTFTTKKAAFAGELAIKTGENGDAELGTTLEIGTKLTATVTEGNETQASHYTYKWYRTKGAQADAITNATEKTYTVTKDDLGATISVEIIAADESFETKKSSETPAVVKKANTITVDASIFGEVTTAADGKKTLLITIPDNVTSASRKLEYQIGTGEWVTLPDTNKIPLENKAYAADTIKVRVQATDEIKESDDVSYNQEITATLAASVEITGTLKYDETLTANATITDDEQSGATLKYQFFSVDGNNSTPLGEASTEKTYKLKSSEIGKTIKVVVTADGYDGNAEYVTTATVDKADGRTITIEQVISAIVKPNVGTETYTYIMKTVDGAKYQMTVGANSAASETWGYTYTFDNLTPGQSYTFHAIMPETTEYKAGTPISFTIDFPKLTHVPLLLDYNVAGQTVTISQPDQETANIEYTFNGGTTWGTAYEHEYEQGVKEVTIGIRYKDSDIYNEVTPITESLDLSKTDTQNPPEPASIAVKTNPAMTKYQITITEPTVNEGETMEYSLDGVNYTTKSDIESQEFGANATVTLYYRKKATATANASKTQLVGQELYGASATPVITGAEGATTFKDSLEVTLKASGTIYYTTDGSTPTVDEKNKYTGPFTINATTTVKAIALESDRIISEVASEIFTKDNTTTQPVTPPTNDNTWTGSTTTPSTDNKKDDNKTEDKATTTTETKADGTKVTTTETKAEDGSVTAKVELKNETTGVEATVKVAKDADGKVTDATAAVTQTSADKKAGLSAATVAQITEAAGTKAVEINAEIVDESGNTLCRLAANAEDLKAGNKLKVLKYDSKTREYVLVNKTTYKVDKDGNLAMNDLKRASYMVVTAREAETFSKQVLKTVKVETAKKNVTAGKKTKITLDDGLNMANVAKITYKTSRKSVATVNKNGTITTKKAGTVTVRATVTLKNGKTKSVKMTLTVKKAK